MTSNYKLTIEERKQYISTLPVSLQTAIEKHIQIGGQIKRVHDIREFLIQQIHTKKTIPTSSVNPEYIRYASPLIKRYSMYYLVDSNKLTSSKRFMSEVIYTLGTLLSKIISRTDRKLLEKDDFQDLYYLHNSCNLYKGENSHYCSFDSKEWELSSTSNSELTKEDVGILNKFKDHYLSLFEQAIEESKDHLDTTYLVRDYNHFKKRFSKMDKC